MEREIIIARRKELGLSQTEVAKQCGIGRSHYNLIEKGKRGVSLKTAHKISKVLKIRFNYKTFQ